MATGIETGPRERHSDPGGDDASDEKGRRTVSSKNPVYGQPTTQPAVGTPHDQVFSTIDMFRRYHTSHACMWQLTGKLKTTT